MPATAEAVQSEVTLGRIVRRENAAPETEDTRLLVRATCQEDVMELRTPRETIYADLPCDHFWDADTSAAFAGQEVAIRLAVDHVRFQIFIETPAGAQSEFTVGGVWLDVP